MNCLTPADAAKNTLDALQKEFIGWIDYFHDLYPDPSDLEDILLTPLKTHPLFWIQSPDYRDMKFEFDRARDTFETIYNNFQRFFGQSAAFDFLGELTKQVKETVQGRLQYWKDKEAEDAQLIFTWELKQAIEGRQAG